MKHYLFIFALTCLLLSFGACTIRPRQVLSAGKMREVLYDLHRTDGIMQVKGYNYGHDEDLARYYQVVLQKHGVTQAEFDSSIVWYTDNPKRFNKIYPPVIKRLQAEYDRLKLADEARLTDTETLGEPIQQTAIRSFAELQTFMQNGLPLPETMREPLLSAADSLPLPLLQTVRDSLAQQSPIALQDTVTLLDTIPVLLP